MESKSIAEFKHFFFMSHLFINLFVCFSLIYFMNMYNSTGC